MARITREIVESRLRSYCARAEVLQFLVGENLENVTINKRLVDRLAKKVPEWGFYLRKQYGMTHLEVKHPMLGVGSDDVRERWFSVLLSHSESCIPLDSHYVDDMKRSLEHQNSWIKEITQNMDKLPELLEMYEQMDLLIKNINSLEGHF